MEIFQSLMYAVLPIVGIVIGAVFQYVFSRTSEERKHQQNLRAQAYVDFLRGVSGVAISQKNNDKTREQEFMVLLTDSKARIAVYETKKVIQKIANFWRAGARTDTPERMRLFVNICQR